MEWKNLVLGQESCRYEVSAAGTVERLVIILRQCQDYNKIDSPDQEQLSRYSVELT